VRDATALSQSITMLLRDREMAASMGRSSRSRAVERFDWDVIAKDWDASYRLLF
jgi:glycosyltransferase involved in cell wall biosynthesis